MSVVTRNYNRRIDEIDILFSDRCEQVTVIFPNNKQYILELARDEDAAWKIKEGAWHLTRWHSPDGQVSIQLHIETAVQPKYHWLTTVYLNVAELELVYQHSIRRNNRPSRP